MFAIAFDLVVADVEAHCSRHVSQAYSEVGRTLRRFGFAGVQGSVYVCDDENLSNLSSAMNALRALPWFPACVRDIRAFRVEQWSDFTAFMKEPARMKSAVVVFPGSNCDRDCAVAIERSTGERPAMVWHGERELPGGLDLIVLPGGFAHGDYLRCGAMAALSPVMAAVVEAAERGVAVAGICNGFQVLCETGLLPGALLRNARLKYVCKHVPLRVENAQTRFTAGYGERREAVMTVGNGEGNYYADEETLDRLEGEGRVVFRYLDNPNGSARDIAGIVNEAGNVLGLMPHPDRAFEPELGSADGAVLFQSIAASA